MEEKLLLVDENEQNVFIPVGKVKGDSYTAEDCIVSMIKYSQSVTLSKGHFQDDYFIFENEQEIENVIAALSYMLLIIAAIQK